MEKIKLIAPIETKDSGTLEELEIRRPRVKDLRLAQKTGGTSADQDVRLLATLTGLRPEDIDNMDAADYMAAQKVMQGFFGLSETTADEQS